MKNEKAVPHHYLRALGNSLCLTIVLGLLLAACGSEPTPTPAPTPSNPPTTNTTAPATTTAPTTAASTTAPATTTSAPTAAAVATSATVPTNASPAPTSAMAGPPSWFNDVPVYDKQQKLELSTTELTSLGLTLTQFYVTAALSSDPVITVSDFYNSKLTGASWKVVQNIPLGKEENGIQITLNRLPVSGPTQVLIVLVANSQGLAAAPQTRALASKVPAGQSMILLIAQADPKPIVPSTPETTNLPADVAAENLTFDFGDGWKAQGQLTYPAGEDGPFPTVILVHGSGANDMDETLSESVSGVSGGSKVFRQIAYYLPTRGFAVLRYNRRGVIGLGPQLTTDPNIKVTHNKLTQDAGFVLKQALKNSRVDPQRVIMLGHSEGTLNVSTLVTSPEGKDVAGVVLMGVQGYDLKTLLQYQLVDRAVQYSKDSDQNKDGKLSYDEFATAFRKPGGSPLGVVDPQTLYDADPATPGRGILKKSIDKDGDGLLDIENELRPLLQSQLDTFPVINLPGFGQAAAPFLQEWQQSGSVTSVLPAFKKPVLLLNGEGDTQTVVQGAKDADAALEKAGNPDHKLITYPALGHTFYPTQGLIQPLGPMQAQVLKDMGDWLSQHFAKK